jgi:hypothetical protein
MSAALQSSDGLTLSAAQRMILQMYGQRDASRVDSAEFLWVAEDF